MTAPDTGVSGFFKVRCPGLVFIGRVSSPLGTQLFSEDLSSERTLFGERGTWRASSSETACFVSHRRRVLVGYPSREWCFGSAFAKGTLARRVGPHRIYRLPAAFGLYSEAGRKFMRGEIQRTSGISRSCREDPEARSGIQVQEGSAEPIRRYRRI